jgi:hypothetical protein
MPHSGEIQTDMTSSSVPDVDDDGSPRSAGSSLTRRGLIAAGTASSLLLSAPAEALASTATSGSSGGLPVHDIEKIIGADGHVSNGVLSISISRDDITTYVHGVRFVPGFQVEHDLYFQSLGGGRAILNGDIALKPSETQRVISAFLREGLAFQAFHQHLYDMEPDVWFMHYRGVGEVRALARRIRTVIDVTGTKLPQSSPAHSTTHLPAEKLAKILGGEATIGEHGVVTVDVSRAHGVRLGTVEVRPELGVSTNVQFQPLAHGAAAVVADFSMTAAEIQPVMKTMRRYRWDVGCLYNQETAEIPQLYFSHMFKTGDPVLLARQIRAGLEHTDVG